MAKKLAEKHGIPAKFFRGEGSGCLAHNVGTLKKLLAELPDDLPINGDLEDDNGNECVRVVVYNIDSNRHLRFEEF
jgi:hypothetical protein